MKRIFSLISVILITVLCIGALSSCQVLDNLRDALLGGEASEDSDGGSLDNGDADEDDADNNGDSTGNNDSTSGDGTQSDGDGNEETPADPKDETVFLPDGTEDAESADALTTAQRALLSTVIVRTASSNGSGVILSLDRESGDAVIVTNFHVVYYRNTVFDEGISRQIKLYLYGMEQEQYAIEAEYVGGSLTEDIAVLRVSGSEVIKNSLAVSANIGDSNGVSVTDEVLVVGNPEGDGFSASRGIISVTNETITMTASDGVTQINIRVMRIDAGVNQGNSGGGLYDADGKLIGIVNAKKTGIDIDNIAWALPISRVKNLVDSILDNCDGDLVTKTTKPMIGVTLYASAMGVRIDEDGNLDRYELVTVNEVTETCIIPDEIKVGDIITYTVVDGVRLDADRVHMVIDHLLTARVGSTLTIGVLRGGEALEITLTFTEENFVEIN